MRFFYGRGDRKRILSYDIGQDDIKFCDRVCQKIINKFRIEDYQEALSIGRLAMLEASRRFDDSIKTEDKGKLFRCFCFPAIVGDIKRKVFGIGQIHKRGTINLDAGRDFTVDIENCLIHSADGNEAKVINRDLIRKGMAALPGYQRAYVERYYFRDINHQEQSRIDNVSPQVCEKKVKRALVKMRDTLTALEDNVYL